MKRSKAFVASRRDTIVNILQEKGQVSVSDLAEQFSVSPLTIRRDLEYLEAREIVTRQYGTATLVSHLARSGHSEQARSLQAIAHEAAKHVEDGDVIFINASSTALQILKYITAHNVTVVTNNGGALLLDEAPHVSVQLTGGEVHLPRVSMTGERAIDFIKHFSADKCFLGATGVSATYGLTSATAPEPAVNAIMLERSRKHLVVADCSKIGVVASFQFASPNQIDLLVTDTGVSDVQVEKMRNRGVGEIVRVEPVRTIEALRAE